MIDLKNKQPERVVEVEWTSTKGLFMVKIQSRRWIDETCFRT